MRFNALVLHDTPLLVLRDNSMPGAALVGFAPVGGAWFCVRLRLRLKDG
jgi:hypothetical protein